MTTIHSLLTYASYGSKFHTDQPTLVSIKQQWTKNELIDIAHEACNKFTQQPTPLCLLKQSLFMNGYIALTSAHTVSEIYLLTS